jgi:hypothetical protein
MNTKKIGWQKYEDYIEKQLSSPVLNNIIQNIASTKGLLDDEDSEEEDEESYEIEGSNSMVTPLMALTSQIVEDVAVLANFDCWMGHTNFDVTPSIKNILDKAPGIEMLKICSRYRFFIAIGRMFDFTEVRKYIEDLLLEGD